MDILKIPFIEKVGITKGESQRLELQFDKSLHNHLETIHASAQFALAETASGEALMKTFPELVGKVIPLLRDSKVKFKKPAVKKISAEANIDQNFIKDLADTLEAKGRVLLPVNVKLVDTDGTVTFTGEFSWFLQKL